MDLSECIIRDATMADAVGIASVHVVSWRETYPGIIPATFLERVSLDRRTAHWQQQLATPPKGTATLVAERPDTGEIVGFADAGPNRSPELGFDAELYALYLLKTCQGAGIGRELVRANAARLLRAGYRSLCTWVLAENSSCGFYKALGGTVIGEKEESFDGVPLRELAYGWRNLATLAPK